MNNWHKQIVKTIRDKTGCNHKTAMEILGEMVELNQAEHIQSFNRGYEQGINKGKEN